MRLDPWENTRFRTLLRGWSDTAPAQSMRGFVQHGEVSTYEHCMQVARASFWINRRLHLGSDEPSLVRGAFLHDFYLYDWHHCREICRWHGFQHPGIALQNAARLYPLNPREENIIASHMWPLTPLKLPRCREAFVVCLADKACSLHETHFRRAAHSHP